MINPADNARYAAIAQAGFNRLTAHFAALGYDRIEIARADGYPFGSREQPVVLSGVNLNRGVRAILAHCWVEMAPDGEPMFWVRYADAV